MRIRDHFEVVLPSGTPAEETARIEAMFFDAFEALVHQGIEAGLMEFSGIDADGQAVYRARADTEVQGDAEG